MSSIHEKIQKVLELARRGGTEAEADTAMRMALELLAKHNLSMSDVEKVEVKDEDVMEAREDAPRDLWQSWIWNAISDLYFCTFYKKSYRLNGKHYRSYVVIGRESNVATAREVASYLCKLGEELASKGDRLYRNSFKNGYGTRIYQRATEEKKKAMEGHLIDHENSCTALVVRDMYALRQRENKDFLAAQGVQLRHRSSYVSARDERGYADGKAAGSKVSLSRAPQGRLN